MPKQPSTDLTLPLTPDQRRLLEAQFLEIDNDGRTVGLVPHDKPRLADDPKALIKEMQDAAVSALFARTAAARAQVADAVASEAANQALKAAFEAMGPVNDPLALSAEPMNPAEPIGAPE